MLNQLGVVSSVGERYLQCVLQEYITYFNLERAHQGINQQIPTAPPSEQYSQSLLDSIQSIPILNGFHLHYRRAA